MPRTKAGPLTHGIPLTLFAVGTLLLSGCSAGTPPEETAEQLTEITADPSPAEAADELTLEETPEPVVDPLECSNYLTITARGTGEPSKRQLLAPVTRDIAQAFPEQVTTVDLDYPATGEIKEGATYGVRALIDTLNQQSLLCPEQAFILLGYSQGALVVGESLSQAADRLVGETVGELTLAATMNIAAVVLYADPRFVGSDDFIAGTARPSTNGLLERRAGALDDFADRTVSYCVAEDFICQATQSITLNEEGHVAYYTNGMQESGAAFVIEQLQSENDHTGPVGDELDVDELLSERPTREPQGRRSQR